MKTVAIIGTFDTKGEEFAYVKTRFEELGINTITIHCGVFDPQTMPDVTNTEVAAAVDIEMSTIAKKERPRLRHGNNDARRRKAFAYAVCQRSL